jgi:hypothetical protein
MKSLLFTLSALAIATSLSFAQDKPAGQDKPQRGNPEESFKKLDKNSDGALTLDEYKASPRAQKDTAKAEASYKKMDKNSDDKVTLEEYKAARPTRQKGGADQGGKTPPPADPAK